MTHINQILMRIAEEEARFRDTLFLAPCVRGGRVRARAAGMIQTFRPQPAEFEGWALFRARSSGIAEFAEEAEFSRIATYLALFPPIRMHLAHPLSGSTWLAYPANESDAAQRRFPVRPAAVHLITDGAPFEPVIVRRIGENWWFEEIDRRADPRLPEQLRAAFQQVIPPESLRLAGMTPEMRVTYSVAAQRSEAFAVHRGASVEEVTRASSTADERRIRNALRFGGGELCDFRDRGEYWQVDWTTRDGQQHTSAISRKDLTVLSAGICLSDRDSELDLQSLVGVVELRPWDW